MREKCLGTSNLSWGWGGGGGHRLKSKWQHSWLYFHEFWTGWTKVEIFCGCIFIFIDQICDASSSGPPSSLKCSEFTTNIDSAYFCYMCILVFPALAWLVEFWKWKLVFLISGPWSDSAAACEWHKASSAWHGTTRPEQIRPQSGHPSLRLSTNVQDERHFTDHNRVCPKTLAGKVTVVCAVPDTLW